MVRQTATVIALEILGVISLMGVALIGFLAYALSQGPLELGMFRQDVERAMTSARGGRPVQVENLTLEWATADRRFYIVASNVALMDQAGAQAGWADKARLTLDTGAVLTGTIEPLEVEFEGGWLSIQNKTENIWTVAGEPLPPIRAAQLPTSPRAWLNLTNRVLSDLLAGFLSLDRTSTLRMAGFDRMELRVENAGRERLATIEDASGRIEQINGNIGLSVAGVGEGVGLPGRFEMSLLVNKTTSSLQANLDVGAWPLANLLSRLGLNAFRDSDVVVGTHFAAEVQADTGLKEFDFLLASQEGQLRLPVVNEALNAFTLYAGYKPADDSIDVKRLDFESAKLKAVMTGRIDHVLGDGESRRVQLATDLLDVDLTPYFPEVWQVEDLLVEADLANDLPRIDIRQLAGTIAEVEVLATGVLDLDPVRAAGQLPFRLELAAETSGDLSKETVLAFWPTTLGAGARDFVADRMRSVTLAQTQARLTLQPDSFEQGFLRDEDLDVRFSFMEGEVRFLEDIPPITGALGTGWLKGNSFGLELLNGELEDWTLSSGLIDFPKLNPRGQNFFVSMDGSGPAASMMQLVSDSRLQVEARTGFDPSRISGNADLRFFMERPARTEVSLEDVTIKVNGTVLEGGLVNVIPGFDLEAATTQIDLTKERLILTGFGDVGSAPVQFTWRDGLDDGGQPADISASAIITPDVLNAFGLVGRAYLNGEIPVEVQGQVGTTGLGQATFGLDLTEARIAIDEIGWVKAAGEAARATLTYSGDPDSFMSSVRVVGDGARLDGDLRLDGEGRLDILVLRELFMRGAADVSGTISRPRARTVDMALEGAYLDISPLLAGFDGLGSDQETEPLGLALNISANVDRLRVRRGLDLNNARLQLVNGLDRLISVEASGTNRTGATFGASYYARDPDQPPTVGITSSDAGFLAEAFFGVDFLSGGELNLSGTLGDRGAPSRLMARIRNARLTNAPFVTQILSLASLRGLSDTLSGDGVLFTEIVAPITIGGGRYVIEGGRASGPALGLTVNGFFAGASRRLELNGVLVPSFGVNSVLGGIPVIGDLVVGRQGEGIFSITYAIAGTLDKAQVTVNPLSAVTPGILRRIFENPSDVSIPASLDIDPTLKPPPEKLPELPEDEFIETAPGGG